MKFGDIKKTLHVSIDQIDDEEFLMELNMLVDARVGKSSPYKFGPAQLDAIAEGRKQVAAGMVSTHEEVMAEAEEWLNEK